MAYVGQGNMFGTNIGRWELVEMFEEAANEAYRSGDTTMAGIFDRLAGHLSVGGEHMVLQDVQYELDNDPEFYNDLMDYLPRKVVVGIAGN